MITRPRWPLTLAYTIQLLYITNYISPEEASKSGYTYDATQGLLRYNSNGTSNSTASTKKEEPGKIAKAESEFIFTYLMSDNYVYTIANFNLVSKEGDYSGFWGFFKNIPSEGNFLL